jgi:hypothetical protein
LIVSSHSKMAEPRHVNLNLVVLSLIISKKKKKSFLNYMNSIMFKSINIYEKNY